MSDIPEILELKPRWALAVRSRLGLYFELTKARIIGLVLVATMVGFCLAHGGPATLHTQLLLFHTLLGTALMAAGANALNQVLEVEHDRKMARTQGRPLPAGRMTALEAVLFGGACAAAAVLYLAAQVNLLCAMLAALACASYVFLYTPLKRATPSCVLVGAVPGALPPVIGWAGGAGEVGLGAALLFAIVFFWQLPHFAAIAWQYRDDYGRAGYPMLAVVDTEGSRLNLHMITHMTALIAVSLLPVVYGLAGSYYAVGALVLGLAFLASCAVFVMHKTQQTARSVVLTSVIYLPLLLALMMFDKQ